MSSALPDIYRQASGAARAIVGEWKQSDEEPTVLIALQGTPTERRRYSSQYYDEEQEQRTDE